MASSVTSEVVPLVMGEQGRCGFVRRVRRCLRLVWWLALNVSSLPSSTLSSSAHWLGLQLVDYAGVIHSTFGWDFVPPPAGGSVSL